MVKKKNQLRLANRFVHLTNRAGKRLRHTEQQQQQHGRNTDKTLDTFCVCKTNVDRDNYIFMHRNYNLHLVLFCFVTAV